MKEEKRRGSKSVREMMTITLPRKDFTELTLRTTRRSPKGIVVQWSLSKFTCGGRSRDPSIGDA